MAETAEQLVAVTDLAIDKFQELLKEGNEEGIRLSVVGGGCAGLNYDMKADNFTEGDLIQEQGGVKFFMHPMVVPYLKGMTIDYSKDLMDGGFKFINPNASSTCGCGTSFGV